MSSKRLPARDNEPGHPADVLAHEHDILLSVLAAIESESRRLRRGAPMRGAWWVDAVLFFEQFVDRCHHLKEEQYLFPALDGAGVLPDDVAVAQLRYEHDAERTLLSAMHDAALSGTAVQLADAADAYRNFMAGHIAKENVILLNLTKHALDGKAIETVQLGFDSVHRRTMHLQSELLALAHSLCRTAGVSYQAKPEGLSDTNAKAC